VIGEVAPGTPAQAAGLRPLDRVVSAAGEPVRTWADFVEVVRAHAAQPLALGLERDGQPVSLTVTPASERELNAEGDQVEVGRLGVSPNVVIEHREIGAVDAFRRG